MADFVTFLFIWMVKQKKVNSEYVRGKKNRHQFPNLSDFIKNVYMYVYIFGTTPFFYNESFFIFSALGEKEGERSIPYFLAFSWLCGEIFWWSLQKKL